MFSYYFENISEARETLSEAVGYKNSQILYLESIMPFASYFYLPVTHGQTSLAVSLGD